MNHLPLLLALTPPIPLDTNSEVAAYIARSLFLVGLGGTLLVLAVRRLRQFRLRERYTLLFVLLGLPFIALAFWQEGMIYCANLLHVQVPTFALLCIASFLFFAVFELLTIVSVLDRKVTTLAQLAGMLMEQQKLNDRLTRENPHAVTSRG